jgi:hypothetical protein
MRNYNELSRVSASMAQKRGRFLQDWGTLVVTSVNFASIHFLTIIWNLDLFAYLLLIIVVSCFASFLASSIENAIKHTFASLVIGVLIALGALISPPFLYGRSIMEINAVVAFSLGVIAKFLLLGLALVFVGIVLGWFLNDRFSEF